MGGCWCWQDGRFFSPTRPPDRALFARSPCRCPAVTTQSVSWGETTSFTPSHGAVGERAKPVSRWQTCLRAKHFRRSPLVAV